MEVLQGMKGVLIILGLCLALIYLEVEANGHRQTYGNSCSKNKKCDFTKWFRCEKGKCICFENKGKVELFYDEIQERCVGRSGTNCTQKFYPFDDDEVAHFFHMRGATTNHWRYGNGSLRCGSNAFCDNDGTGHRCKCRQNYFEGDDGKCYKLKSYGDTCTMNKECDPDGFLTCTDEICLCQNGGRVYDAELNKCTVQAGLPCVVNLNRFDGHKVDDCTTNSVCHNGVCRCDYGTQIHSDLTCQRGFGKECDSEHPCGDSKLSCRSKVCQCKYPLHMKYDEAEGQCLGVASGPCVFNDTSELAIQCTKNAECVERGMFHECKCKAGYIQTIEGDCVKTRGAPCDVDNDCDRVGPLACINSQCDCVDLLLKYDERSRKCKGLVGSRCKLGEDSCVENASCSKFEEVAGGSFGKCLWFVLPF